MGTRKDMVKHNVQERVVQLLVEAGELSESQVQQAETAQREQGGELVDILFAQNVLQPSTFLEFLVQSPQISANDVSFFDISSELIAMVPSELAHRYQVVPVSMFEDVLTVASPTPLDPGALAELSEIAGAQVRAFLCRREDVQAALDRYYGDSADTGAFDASNIVGLHSSLRLSHISHLIRRIKTLPALPETVNRVREAADDPDVSIADVVDLITLDPPVAAKILSVANSPIYGFSHRINELQRAVSLLGLREIYNIVLSITVADLLKKWKHFNYREFWFGSVCCAVASRLVAETSGRRRFSGAFTAGLLRDIGRPALWEVAPERCAALDSELEGLDLVAEEEAQLGLAHTEAGYELARHWNLPEEISAAIRFHHQPERATDHQEYVAIVAVGDLLARAKGNSLDDNPGIFDREDERSALDVLQLDVEIAEAMLERYLSRKQAAAIDAFS